MRVGDLKRQLEQIPDDWELTFGGQLFFERIKQRGPKLVDIEFTPLVYWDPAARVWQVVGAEDGPG